MAKISMSGDVGWRRADIEERRHVERSLGPTLRAIPVGR
jgi:hypothetical protein